MSWTCPSCGDSNAESINKCVCGFMIEDNVIETNASVQDQPVKTNIHGIGGWLALLIVGLMVLGPLTGFGRLSDEFQNALVQYPQLAANSQWQNYRQICWLIFAGLAAVSFAAGYRLWKIHSPESVRFAIIALWLIGPIGNALYIVSAAAVFGSIVGDNALAAMIGAVAPPCIVAAIWTTYLMRSDRVKNTYRTLQPQNPSSENRDSMR